MNSLAFRHAPAVSAPLRRAVTIDLVHLSRQTFGDRALETELLRLFDTQLAAAETKLAALAADLSDARSAQARELAHLLEGSARALGSHEIAASAETYEEALATSDRADIADARAFLLGRIAATRADIADLLA